VASESTPLPAGPATLRAWWLRTVLVLSAPRAVFVALRADDDEEAAQRSEPVLAIALLAGIAFVLSTSTTAHIMDADQNGLRYDGLLVAVWVFLAGAFFGAVGYWLLGAALHASSVLLGSQGSFRRSRHVLAFAAVPVACSLALWPLKLLLYGDALFHAGGADAGTGGKVFAVVSVGFLAWSLCLVVLGVRAVHGWGPGRALAASAAPVAVGAAVYLF
jgi:hypothetical protein